MVDGRQDNHYNVNRPIMKVKICILTHVLNLFIVELVCQSINLSPMGGISHFQTNCLTDHLDFLTFYRKNKSRQAFSKNVVKNRAGSNLGSSLKARALKVLLALNMAT